MRFGAASDLPRRRLVAFLVIGLVAGACGVAAYAAHLGRALELSSVDARFDIRGPQGAPRDVTVVAIDAKTFGELGRPWPFPRSLHARLLDRLREAGARVVAYDVQFTEGTTAREDAALIAAVDRTPRIVLGTSETDGHGRTGVLGGDRTLRRIGARAGSMQLPADGGGVLRRLPYATDGLTSLSVVAAGLANGAPIPRERFAGDDTWIDFQGPPGTIRTVSFVDVLRGRVPAAALKDRVVIVGASAPTLQDVHPTSFASDEQMAGPEIQANAVVTALAHAPLQSSPVLVDVLLIVLLGLLVPAATAAWRARWAVTIGVVAAVLVPIGAQIAFNSGVVVPVVAPLGTLAAGAAGALVLYSLFSVLDRQRVRDTFARFVPESVVDQVLVVSGGAPRLGGVQQIATVLFSDLRGFTTFSEGRSPDLVIEILNRYLTEMSEAILDHGGTLVSYMGDGIMAVFGAPLLQEDHADRAVSAAFEMAGPRLDHFNAELRREGFDVPPFRMGVGVNTGPVMSGNVGSLRRLEYTVIGDTTNTASRIEGMTKNSGHHVFVADTTVHALTREPVAPLEPVGDMEVRGRRDAVKLWALLLDDDTADAAPEA